MSSLFRRHTLAAAACTDARTVTGMIASVIAWPLSALRGLPLLDRTIRVLARRGSAWSILRTAVVSLALLLVFGGLLASAEGHGLDVLTFRRIVEPAAAELAALTAPEARR